MSIIVAVISDKCGVVASDGRKFTSAIPENGKVVKNAEVSREDFDKTFLLEDGRVVSAFCGLLCFSGSSVSQHVEETIAQNAPNPQRLADLAEAVEEGMIERLDAIHSEEVAFGHRNLDVLIVGREALRSHDFQIVSLSFRPCQDRISCKREVVCCQGQNQYYIHGNDDACAGAVGLLTSNESGQGDVVSLRKLASSAVKAGIQSAGQHQYAQENACGGTVFIKHCKG